MTVDSTAAGTRATAPRFPSNSKDYGLLSWEAADPLAAILTPRRRAPGSELPIMADESVWTSDACALTRAQGPPSLLIVYPGKNGGIANSLEIVHVPGRGLALSYGQAPWNWASAVPPWLHLSAAVPEIASASTRRTLSYRLSRTRSAKT